MAAKSSKSKTSGSRRQRHNGKLTKKQEATLFALFAKKLEGAETADE